MRPFSTARAAVGGSRRRQAMRAGVGAAVSGAMVLSGLAVVGTPGATAAPVGQGFNLNASDLRFILKQIRIAERHADTLTVTDPCGTLVSTPGSPVVDQIPVAGQGRELPWGLRTVDGTCNNLVPGQTGFGTADRDFPRMVGPVLKPAEQGTSYDSDTGTVRDSQPRVISNLVVDQTAANPAAVDAAGESPVTTPSGAFFIPNVAPDVGLSAPYNSWFTLFGQFFDHGLDLVNKGGNGSVFVPLKQDDPLYDPAPGAPNFMILTRATHGGDHEANNQTSPFVDQSQTYTSHPSHQVFLRQYATVAGDPQPTGRLLEGPQDGMATWDDVKVQAETLLGIQLTDADALDVPLLATDPYGRFTRGPNGFPQLVVPGSAGGLVEGNPAAPVPTTGAARTGHAFLDDINAFSVPGAGKVADGDSVVNPPPAGPPSATTYDDEMLDAHFVAGDGRVNENIGLTAVHHIFHSEHNRLVGDIQTLLDSPAVTAAERADWRATDRYTARDGGYTYEERLFQAARFVTEMEYQHLAFEEFIRKVQPLVNPFGEGGTGYNTSIDPAIKAEFAHAVYRFGHSMLTESVDRVRVDGTPDHIPLLDAFLNPPAFLEGGQSPNQAAGNVVRGMTRQVGNELDEFVTEALRNELLGLPLDLATLNLARARETGVPTLNAARRAFSAESNNSALAPYQSWADFGFSIKHPTSLNNFIAAYGRHPSITGATTLAAKRAAADALVHGANGPDGDVGTPDDIANVPADRYAFLNSVQHETVDADGVVTPGHSDFVSRPDGSTTTGVDDIDLWVGGLAEKQMVFGGLLGPTFNYVFEGQMEDLQFGDRFYYLSRTAGLNMLTQLEGNSFSELIQRNTDVSGLPADSFSRPDKIFDVSKLGTSGAVLDDPGTTYNETNLLSRMPDGTIRYGGPEHVVFNGTDGNNRVWSSEGDDTVRGDDGDDWMQGGDGNDNLIGGLGDDTLLDSNGDDTLKGGDGNDTLSSGQGFGGDLLQGGRGNDLILHGNDLAESFAGAGDDFVAGGAGDDTVFGDDGDDWIESGAVINAAGAATGGGAFNLLQGDNGAPFQDDLNEAGHDVLLGYGGETDYDAEGGDDVMLLGPGIQRSEGMLGFDYATHKGDPAAADSDLEFTGLLPPSVETNRDRFDLVETLSGWNRNDVLRGDDRDAAAMEGHELDAAGIARVAGMSTLLPPGATSFTGGNILLGGAGSDAIEGRGGDDVIDGDAFLNTRISIRDAVTGAEIDSEDKIRDVQARVTAGTLRPGQLLTVREVLRPADATAVDTVEFSGPRAEYTVTFGTGTVTVAHVGGTAADGTDTIRNAERLQFADQTISAAPPVTSAPGAPTIGAVTARDSSATVAFTAPVSNGGSPVTGYSVRVLDAGGVPVGGLQPAAGSPATVTGLVNGQSYRFQVAATNAIGTGAFSALSAAVTPVADVAPTVSVQGPSGGTVGVAVTANVVATFSEAVNGVTAARFTLRQGTAATGTLVARVFTYDAATLTATLDPRASLLPNTVYTARLLPGITDTTGTPLAPVTWSFTTGATVPGAPVIGTAAAGVAGGPITATARWAPPAATGGSAITGYRVRALRMSAGGAVLSTTTSEVQPATSRSLAMTLPVTGNYRFTVQAVNAVDPAGGAQSARSNLVAGR